MSPSRGAGPRGRSPRGAGSAARAIRENSPESGSENPGEKSEEILPELPGNSYKLKKIAKKTGILGKEKETRSERYFRRKAGKHGGARDTAQTKAYKAKIGLDAIAHRLVDNLSEGGKALGELGIKAEVDILTTPRRQSYAEPDQMKHANLRFSAGMAALDLVTKAKEQVLKVGHADKHAGLVFAAVEQGIPRVDRIPVQERPEGSSQVTAAVALAPMLPAPLEAVPPLVRRNGVVIETKKEKEEETP